MKVVQVPKKTTKKDQFWNNQVALSQIDNGESNNNGSENSGLTLETPGCKY